MQPAPLDGLQLRPVRDEDGEGLVRLVGAAYDEYPGCVLDLPGVDDDLPAPETAAAQRGGRWWVLTNAGQIVGSIGTGAPSPDGVVELKRCYLDAAWRGRGLATRLIRRVEEHAAALGASYVDLWSDTRFAAAHHRYTRLGYDPTGETRELHDPSETTEYRFLRTLEPSLDPAIVRFSGQGGDEEVVARALPDGSVLRGRVGEVGYEVEVDLWWRPRRVTLEEGVRRLRLTSDGQGRWWRDGEPAPDLEGCTDLELVSTAASLQPVVRRLALGTGEQAEVRVAAVHGVAEPLMVRTVTWVRQGVRSYACWTTEARTEVEVDRYGLPVRVGDRWQRTTPIDGDGIAAPR